MAIISTAQSGNWSNPTTWVGGVVPGINDDARLVSTHVITADVDINVNSIFQQNWPTTNTGSQLLVNTSRNITATDIYTAFDFLINITANSPSIVTITGNIYSNSLNSGTEVAIIRKSSGSATINIIGTLTGKFHNTNNISALKIESGAPNSIINVTGTVQGWVGAGSVPGSGIECLANSCTINVTGIVRGQSGSGIRNTSTSTLININGQTIASNTINAVVSSGDVAVGGVITNSSTGRMAISANIVKILSTINTQWLFQTDNALVTKTLYDVNTLPTIPTVNNVRSGVTYASGALTGTLVVPPANAVTAGVTFDNGTTGTAQNTAASFLTALAASSDPLAVRLKNVATVQTTGDQIAAAL